MKNVEVNQTQSRTASGHGERGSAIVIALFMLALIGVFVALAMSRSSAEAAATGNESAESRTFYAAQGSLETMTRNFNKVFEVKLNPTATDLNNVRNGTVPGMGTYTFLQELEQTDAVPGTTVTTLTGGPYTGLIAIQDTWRLRTTATSNNGTTANPIGTQVQLTRNVLNNRIPIFQFGIFYNDDLELFRPPRFSFGGRVHSNGNFFISPGADGVYFDSRVTAADQIVTQAWRNWNTSDAANNQTYVKNASGAFVQLTPTMGSVLNTSFGATDNIFQYPPSVPVPAQTPNPDLPPSRLNANFLSQSSVFDGNLQANTPTLKLPLNVGANTDLIEMVKRGKEVASSTGGDLANINGSLGPVTGSETDNSILRSERFANKTGIRISLADSQAKLPGCASGTGITPIATTVNSKCGVRLDGRADGMPQEPTATSPLPIPVDFKDRVRGYQPKPMKKTASQPNNTTDPYRTTRLNGERFFTGGTVAGREVWIKVETVTTNAGDGSVITADITEDFLSLGVTEVAPFIPGTTRPKFEITDTRWRVSGVSDSRYASSTASTDPSPLGPATAQPPTVHVVDNRSIIKLQRFVIPGEPIPTPSTSPTPQRFTTAVSTGPGADEGFNVVQRYTGVSQDSATRGCRESATPAITPAPTPAAIAPTTDCGTPFNGDAGIESSIASPSPTPRDLTYLEELAHLKRATVGEVENVGIVPFPIKLFDAREGLYYDERSTSYYSDLSQLPLNGMMSMVDIDVANLRRFLRGDFDGLFPVDTKFAISRGGNGLRSSDIPVENGWVLYISDRRGDTDFDGEYDMEDIYGNSPGNNGTMELGEDANRNGALERKFTSFGNWTRTNPEVRITGCATAGNDCEAPTYGQTWYPDFAAVVDHRYYRRGVRLTNGTVLPGTYNSTTPSATRGFTVASENGVYVQGNYNTTGANDPPALGNTPFDQYYPSNSANHIPAAIVADGVTILSNAWNDGQSFRSTTTTPYNQSTRVASTTAMRFAMISGDTIASREGNPNQGGISPRLNGGVHNFKRFLEDWTGRRLDYSGSLINLFNSRNNAGAFKCCNEVYNPPVRNWVFDSTFLDPARLPPGTPFFQYVQTTGFLRTND